MMNMIVAALASVALTGSAQATENACSALTAMVAQGQPEQERTPEEWRDRCDANGNGRVTCAEARAEACGAPIPVTKDHPLYQFMRDGDGDGQVCE